MIDGDRYAGAAHGWATGAAHVYGPLATRLVAAAPHPLAGRRVLDVGAGTGLVSDALRAVGAYPVGLDASLDMLTWDHADRPPALAASVTAMGMRDGSVDDAIAAFVLNHVPDPVAGLREMVRVCHGGGALLATVYASTNQSAVRERVDEVAVAHGYAYPDWYRELKTEQAPLLGDADAMDAAAREAGLHDVDVTEEVADIGLVHAVDLVDYRLGQAHFAAWRDALGERGRDAVRAASIAAVSPVMEPYRPRVVRLVAVTPG